ncbi:MAG TPA: hypothetical protein DEA96_17745 [Leptospiraceae bacterium]|nr:hypothetical protein [Spirochaetaceae bacterium]HBS06818.1 hypothetical protein [Leptospiraceae bacterium]|tara:strand:+ start:9582 stop:9782 length:201 start_codon:yes stop_codon:yes gene_type:complete
MIHPVPTHQMGSTIAVKVRSIAGDIWRELLIGPWQGATGLMQPDSENDFQDWVSLIPASWPMHRID